MAARRLKDKLAFRERKAASLGVSPKLSTKPSSKGLNSGRASGGVSGRTKTRKGGSAPSVRAKVSWTCVEEQFGDNSQRIGSIGAESNELESLSNELSAVRLHGGILVRC